MNYDEFLKYKQDILLKNPDIIDLSENNLYTYFKEKKDHFESNNGLSIFVSNKQQFYRCHTVEAYLAKFNLPNQWKEFTGASLGIRNTLTEIIFKNYHKLIIPKDVYPFYKAAKFICEYETINKDNIFESLPDGELLICYPFKTNSSNFSAEKANNYLKRNNKNRIIFDMVYLTNWSIPKEILDLYYTNQVILLHSLSKTYLIPNHFGIALLPQNEEGKTLYLQFRNINKDDKKLIITNFYLQQQNADSYRLNINHILEKNNIKLNHDYHFNLSLDSYLHIIPVSFQDLLNKNILAIPASVFGSDRSDICIISSLI